MAGQWAKLATLQLVKFPEMTTRDAMRLVAYWKGRRKTSAIDWRPVLSAVLREAPERKRITSRLIASDRLLKLIFGETKTRPRVKPGVQAAVVDFIERSARILDRDKPDAVPPDIPNRVLDVASQRLARFLETPTPSRGVNAALLFVLFLLATKGK